MITRIEIDGYKSFERFALELKPLTVIAGINAVGKSNLFDALRHLSYLVSKTLSEAFETARGSQSELFMVFPDGTHSERITYAVELFLPDHIVDQFSDREDLKYRRVRYELEIGRGEENRLFITRERLTSLKRGEDPFLKRHKEVRGMLPKLTGGRPPFIDTVGDGIVISQDRRAGRKRRISLEGAQRTVLSSITTVEFPHAYAVRRLLEGIHFLQLNPEMLRIPSPMVSSPYLMPDGKNLAAVIARLTKNDDTVLQMISNDLAALVPGVDEVMLKTDERREEYVIEVRHVDGYIVPSKLLSDGTLRILALIAISYDPEFRGTIILEEPENGIYPGRLPQVVKLLKKLADSSGGYPGLRQLIVNTHSPLLIEHFYRDGEDNIIFATLKKVVSGSRRVYTVTRMSYVSGSEELIAPQEDVVAIQELKKILSEGAPVGTL